MWKRWQNRWSETRMTEDEYHRRQAEILKQAPIPVLWLLGKTGSGKTSVIRFLTGAEDVEIGNGFRPQTKFSQLYEFPDAEAPLVRFLDTRGLGEIDYDPAEDLQQFNQSTNAVIVTVRALDHALANLVDSLRQIRQAKPQRPVVLVITCLHEAYSQQQHPRPDPFTDDCPVPENLPSDLRRSLQLQIERFDGLVDRVVPVDLTEPEEGFQPPDFGGVRLRHALLDILPTAYREALFGLDAAVRSLEDLNDRRALPHVVGHSILAGTAAAVPLPWVDIPMVTALQTHMVYRLARLYEQPVGARMFFEISGPIAGRLLARQALRGFLKFVPYLGSAANAAVAYAHTYGLGKACCWYFGQLRQGNTPTAARLQEIWQAEIARAAKSWSQHNDQEDRS